MGRPARIDEGQWSIYEGLVIAFEWLVSIYEGLTGKFEGSLRVLDGPARHGLARCWDELDVTVRESMGRSRVVVSSMGRREYSRQRRWL